uniref:BESS domain-containing protein n=1 Tax=Lygus hesperus TaxID=30085 RepID=A0A0A9WB79_LYGHE
MLGSYLLTASNFKYKKLENDGRGCGGCTSMNFELFSRPERRATGFISLNSIRSFATVQSLMEKFSVSKGTLNPECIEVSSNDESDETPSSCKIDAQQSKKESAEGEISNIASSRGGSKSFEGKENKMDVEPSTETSLASSSDAGKIFACSPFTGDEVSIKLEDGGSSNTSQDSKLSCPSVLLPRLVKQGEILVSKKVTLPEAKRGNENEATNQVKNSNSVDDSKNATPLTLMTTEDVRNELRKIPPIKMSSLLNAKSRPLKPKYPPEIDVGGLSMKLKHRAVSSNKIISKRKGWKPIKFRLAEESGSIVKPRSSIDSDSPSSWRPNKPKACPLSKKLNKIRGTSVPNSSNSLNSIRSPKYGQPVKDSDKDKESSSNPPVLPISEDISEYATLNPSEDKDDSSKKTVKSPNRGWFKEKMLEWRREASKLRKDKNNDSIVETNSDTIRESRKNFLISFLPDMDEMSAEQRMFFKSKMMNLICHHQ